MSINKHLFYGVTIMVKLTGRTKRRLAGVYGEIESIRCPVGCKEAVLAIIEKYKTEQVKNAGKGFDLQSTVKSLEKNHKYSQVTKILDELTRSEMLEIIEFFGIDIGKEYQSRVAIHSALMNVLVR